MSHNHDKKKNHLFYDDENLDATDKYMNQDGGLMYLKKSDQTQ
jgi:hypothetical protein